MVLLRAVRRAVSMVVVGGLLVGVSSAAPVPVRGGAVTEAEASSVARQENRPVRVESEVDETTEVLANPDGTLTMIQHVRPVRVRRAGGWVDVDTTLTRNGDTISPLATVVDLALSAGGRGPLVRAGRNGAEVGLDWPGELPEPTLDGPTATYAEVLPGVDLKVTADVTGFSQVLVVKTPAAARDPRLRRVAFGSHAKGLTVTATPDGRLRATDGAGAVVFTGDASRMWDSSGDASAEDRLRGSADGARGATMGVEVTGSTVTIVPDQKFLAAEDTRYPVYLDPSYSCTSCWKNHHNVVQSSFPGAHNFDVTTGQLNDLKAGWWCVSGDCPNTSRTYLRMNTAQLKGRWIHSAALHVTVVNSARCGDAQPTHLSLIGWMDWNTTWSNQPGGGENPGVIARIGSGNRTNNAGNCPSDGGMDLPATDGAWHAANNRLDEVTLMLSGEHEASNLSWRRFALNPYLTVNYNSAPNRPDWMGVEGWGQNPGDAIGCALGAGRPFITTRTPRLRARITDDDGGMMDAGFRVLRGTHDNHTWDGNQTYVAGIPSGSYAEVTVPPGAIPEDGVYAWHLWAGDGQLSNWSPSCEFQVDTVVPGMPEVESAQYPENQPGGGVGKPGTFTFSSAEGTDDTAYYLYSFTEEGGDDPQARVNPSTLNGSVTVSWNPRLSGPQTLSVRAVDRAGNRSDILRYRVMVSDYQVGISGKVAQWSFEDNVRDTSGAKTLTYQGPPPGAYYGPGHQGSGVVADPDYTEYYTAKDALVRTDTSFTVSAWAKLTRTDRSYAIVAQDGERVSGFYLEYHADVNRWVVVMSDKDSEISTHWYYAASEDPPVLNRWTHLAAVFDAQTHRLRLYVDGELSGEAAAPPAPWNATGLFTVGAAKGAGKRIHHFAGAIDSVRVHARALSTVEIGAIRNGTDMASPLAEYLFEDDLDNTGANNDLLPPGNVSYESGYAGKALRDGWAPAPRSLVNTTGSYSVSAWVRLTDKNKHHYIASQDGNRLSGFLLRYSVDLDRWFFGVPREDTDADTYQWAISQSAPKVGVWTHLTAVHDASRHRSFLYVNGVLEAERELTATIDATGAFVVGDAKWQGARTGSFKGLLDEVTVFDGALTAGEAAGLANVPVERARYRLDTPAATDSVGGGQARVHGPSVVFGQHYGAASANITSSGNDHTGTVAGAGPLARWDLNGVLTDATGNGHVLTHRNASGPTAAAFAAGRTNQAVPLNGVDQHLTTAGPVVDTSQSYSVSAWVKLDRADGGSYTAAAQEGPAASAFLLQYSGTHGRWAFGVAEQNGTVHRALSTSPPQTGRWTHLLGVYDKAAGTAFLYVNGHLEASVPFTAPWQSNGPVTLGRAKANNAPVGYLPGAVDEVRLYGRVLTAADAHSLWNLGSDIAAARPPAFRTDQSFTVATWVRAAAYGTAARHVFALDAGQSSPLMIGYRPEWQRWAVIASTGSETQPVLRWVLSDKTAPEYEDLNGWVHLAAVYDAPAKEIRLYVNGVRQSTVPTSATESASSDDAGADVTLADTGRDLLIGRITFGGEPVNHWRGAVRDVRVFSGVLPEACDNGAPHCLSQLPVR
jgi:hypothetical protein